MSIVGSILESMVGFLDGFKISGVPPGCLPHSLPRPLSTATLKRLAYRSE